MTVEYLDASIANEGQSANNWTPGAWTNDPGEGEEWQPEIEAPRINDYAAFKKHKYYGKYFAPYRYRPFPAWLYNHGTKEAKVVKDKDEAIALGADWQPAPFKMSVDMTGKALPVKTDTQRLAEAITLGLADKQTTGSTGAIDPTTIAAIVAAVMAATQKPAVVEAAPAPVIESEPEVVVAASSIERMAMIELAEKEGVKIDKRWSDEKIKQALGL